MHTETLGECRYAKSDVAKFTSLRFVLVWKPIERTDSVKAITEHTALVLLCNSLLSAAAHFRSRAG